MNFNGGVIGGRPVVLGSLLAYCGGFNTAYGNADDIATMDCLLVNEDSGEDKLGERIWSMGQLPLPTERDTDTETSEIEI